MAIIDASFTATINIREKDVAKNLIRNGVPNRFEWVHDSESPFKDWIEPMQAWRDKKSGIYMGYLTESSNRVDKDDVLILNVPPNVPTWELSSNIREVLLSVGVYGNIRINDNYLFNVAEAVLTLIKLGQ